MSVRELVILGTASQVPTRTRNHNGYLLRWDGAGILFDPGEGTQRQLTLAGVPPSTITHICLTHLHGDHCLGLPGIVQRLAVDRIARPVHLYFPASGAPYVDRLLHASITAATVDLVLHPVDDEGQVDVVAGAALTTRWLDHAVDTLGWRVQEPDGVTMVPALLAAAGISGPAVGEIARTGAVATAAGTVELAAVSRPRRGQSFALVMDTRDCAGARVLSEGADLLVCEATFLAADADLAMRYGHLTATEAARLAAGAGVRKLVLTHFSQRYGDPAAFAAEAAAHHSDVLIAEDLHRVPLPRRR